MGDAQVSLRLRESRPADPERGHVPALVFAIVANGSEVGEIALRVGEADELRLYGGQVGYKVYLESRGHGYAAQGLLLLLPRAREAGLRELWITCSPDNVASRRTLERAGASLVEIIDLPATSDMYARGERQKCRFRLSTEVVETPAQAVVTPASARC